MYTPAQVSVHMLRRWSVLIIPILCKYFRVRPTNSQCVMRTVVCGAQTTCSSNEQQCAVTKPPVRRRCVVHKSPVLRTNGACCVQTIGSSCERTCVMQKPPVRRTNGRVQPTNHRFVVQMAVCGTQTTLLPRTHVHVVIAPSVHRANSGVRKSVTEPAIRAVAPAIF